MTTLTQVLSEVLPIILPILGIYALIIIVNATSDARIRARRSRRQAILKNRY